MCFIGVRWCNSVTVCQGTIYCNCNDCNTAVNQPTPDNLYSTLLRWNDCWMRLLPPWLIWSYRDDTYYTSLHYLVSLSTGRSWFKNQLQQVECCDGDFCHSKCVLREREENIIWWNNYWGIEDMWSVMIHPAMMLLQPDKWGLPN